MKKVWLLSAVLMIAKSNAMIGEPMCPTNLGESSISFVSSEVQQYWEKAEVAKRQLSPPKSKRSESIDDTGVVDLLSDLFANAEKVLKAIDDGYYSIDPTIEKAACLEVFFEICTPALEERLDGIQTEKAQQLKEKLRLLKR